MAQSAFTSTESTSSSASTVAPVPPYEQGRRLHIVLDLDHTLVNANEGQQRHHPPDAHARPLHSFVMYNTENGTNPRYLLGLRDGLHDFLQELERLATVASIDSPNPKPNPKPSPSPSPSPGPNPNRGIVACAQAEAAVHVEPALAALARGRQAEAARGLVERLANIGAQPAAVEDRIRLEGG